MSGPQQQRLPGQCFRMTAFVAAALKVTWPGYHLPAVPAHAAALRHPHGGICSLGQHLALEPCCSVTL